MVLRTRLRVVGVLVLIGLWATSAVAQAAVVTRNVNLRAGPSTDHDIIRLLRPTDELVILTSTRTNGYYEVRTAGGGEGWVWGNNIRVSGQLAAVTATAGPPEAYRGCPSEGSAQQEFRRESNRKKNRVASPAQSDIDANATLAALLAPGDDADRWDDRRGASIVAYVVEAKRGGEETVNCGETDTRYRDTHIDVVLNPSTTSKRSRLVVEVTPRWRFFIGQQGQDWSTPALAQHLEGRWVRFTGWLFWDFEHADEAENTNPGGERNWRRTAWEIHPVTEIRVCPGSPLTCD